MVFATVSRAELLTFEPGTKEINGIKLDPSAFINDKDNHPTATKLKLLGAGLRAKPILFVDFNVYVAQFFSDNPAAYIRQPDKAVSSLAEGSKYIAIKMDMLRSVSSSSLVDAFKEALKANHVPLDADMKAAMDLIEKEAEATDGKYLVMLMSKEGNGTRLSYQDAAGKVVSMQGSAKMMPEILSIWLGIPDDDGLARLKSDLLKPVY
jgi:hypothetical protein